MKLWKILFLIFLPLCCVGCESTQEIGKTIWGSSTRVLEEKRSNAISKTYDKGYWETFRAAIKVVEKNKYTMFEKDSVRGFMVIMGIPGAVDTTEVGVFFVEINDHQTRIEITSFSTNAKRILAKALFHGIDVEFGLAQADREFIISREIFKDIGEDFFDKLIESGFLESVSKDGATLKKDLAQMKIELEKYYPNNFEQIIAILEKAQNSYQTQQESKASIK